MTEHEIDELGAEKSVAHHAAAQAAIEAVRDVKKSKEQGGNKLDTYKWIYEGVFDLVLNKLMHPTIED